MPQVTKRRLSVTSSQNGEQILIYKRQCLKKVNLRNEWAIFSARKGYIEQRAARVFEIKEFQKTSDKKKPIKCLLLSIW